MEMGNRNLLLSTYPGHVCYMQYGLNSGYSPGCMFAGMLQIKGLDLPTLAHYA